MPRRTLLSAMIALRLPTAARAFYPRFYGLSHRGTFLGAHHPLEGSPCEASNAATFAGSGSAAAAVPSPPRLRSTATTGEEDVFWGVETYADRKGRLDAELRNVGVDPARLESDAAFLGAQGPALRLYRSFVLPKSAGALACASTPGRARSVAAQVAFACREADASQADWVRNLDAAQSELAAQRAAAPHQTLGGHASGVEADQRLSRSLVLVLDGLRSAENVGNLFRTAEAAGCELVATCGSCPKPPDKAVLKTAVKSADYVPSEHFPSAVAAVAALQAQGFAVWALETTETSERYTDPPRASRASVSAATSPAASAAASYPRKVALVVGNEVTGVAPAALERCDRVLAIPTFGVKNSLNVAVAGSVVAYEVIRAWSSAAAAEEPAP